MNPGRLGLLLLTAALCLVAFMVTVLDSALDNKWDYYTNASLDDFGKAAAASSYGAALTEAWKGKSFDEIIALAQAESDRLDGVQNWVYVPNRPGNIFSSEEEVAAAIADLPALLDALRGGANRDFYITYTGYYNVAEAIREEAGYLSGYGKYLAGIQSQSELQSQSSLFGKPGSFARRNLAKTAEDFEKILGVQVEFGNSRGLERWLDFGLGDYFHLLAIAVIVMSFLEERRRGLWPAVRATCGGRGRLGLTRLGILLTGSLLATVLYSFLPFAVSMCFHGGWGDLTRPLQSVESFGTCPLKISIVQWLLQFFAMKVLSGVLIGLLLWCVLGSITNPQFSVAVLGTTLAAEFVLYEYLPVQSFLNILKYFNIFAYVHTSTLYTDYLNVNLFGFPVGIRTIAWWGLGAVGSLGVLWMIFIQRKRRPEGNRDHLSRASVMVNRVLDVVRSRLSIGGWEGYKTLVYQYGLLLLALVFVISGKLTFLDSDITSSVDATYEAYIADMEGPIDERTDAYLARARELAEESPDAALLLQALDKVEARVTALRERAAKGRYEPWVANEYDYSIVYGPQSQNQQRLNAAIAILMTAILTASLCAFERQAGVLPMVRSTPGGRGRLFRRKALTAALLGAFVWACVYIRELVFVLYEYPMLTAMAVPIGNFDSLAQFPLNLTMGQYVALLYAVRLLMLILTAETSLALGAFCSNVRTAYLLCAAVLGIPGLLSALGAEMFKWVSPVVPVSSAELLWGMGGGSCIIYLLPWLAWLSVAAAAMLVMRKKWVCGR